MRHAEHVGDATTLRDHPHVGVALSCRPGDVHTHPVAVVAEVAGDERLASLSSCTR